MLQSEAALSLRRCLANVGGSMFRSQYLTKIGRPFTQEQPVIGEAELSRLLCITFSHSSPALPETMKSNRSPFFLPPYPLSFLFIQFVCSRETHTATHIPQRVFLKGSVSHKCKFCRRLLSFMYDLLLLWNTKVGIMGLSSFKMTKYMSCELYSMSLKPFDIFVQETD